MPESTIPCCWAHDGIHYINHIRRCTSVACVGYDPQYEVIDTKSPDGVRLMGIEEFRELGYLQEVNRLLLHPAGLALAVETGEDGKAFVHIWDYREDPEGIMFGADVIDKQKIENVRVERERHLEARLAMFGLNSNSIQDPEQRS